VTKKAGPLGEGKRKTASLKRGRGRVGIGGNKGQIYTYCLQRNKSARSFSSERGKRAARCHKGRRYKREGGGWEKRREASFKWLILRCIV